MVGRRMLPKKRKNFLIQGKAFSILCLSLLFFTVTFASFPLGQVLGSPYFYKNVILLSSSSEDPLTSLSLNRWGFLTEHAYLSPQPEIISPTPQVVLPPVEIQIEEQPLIYPQIEGDWEILTMGGKESHVYQNGIYVANSGKVSLKEEDLTTFSSLEIECTEEPQILIYHSHGTESYSQCQGYFYVESDPYRTLDMTQNITTVGAVMAEVFREAGFSVIHDTTLHDYPDYNSSYENSGKTLSYYLETYPSIVLALDVHRDALSTIEGTPYQLLSGDMAQVMLVVGTNGGGYPHDLWQDNFSLALSIQQGLLDYGDFVRPITLRSSRFNQHLSTGALLVEVGGHGNTLVQAQKAGEVFAQSVVDTLTKKN